MGKGEETEKTAVAALESHSLGRGVLGHEEDGAVRFNDVHTVHTLVTPRGEVPAGEGERGRVQSPLKQRGNTCI